MNPIVNHLWELFEEEVFSFSSTDELFNQYRDNDLRFDLPRGNEIRKENLLNYLSSFSKRPKVLIVGEAAGPWGCRFSGIPFTSERLLIRGVLPFIGYKSSIHEPPYSEVSATIFWKSLLHYYQKFLVWNVIPFHPHRRGEMLSIRRPRKDEIFALSEVLSRVLTLMKPARVVALGRIAEFALSFLKCPSIYVRHPSQSGAREFRRDIGKIFKGVFSF